MDFEQAKLRLQFMINTHLFDIDFSHFGDPMNVHIVTNNGENFSDRNIPGVMKLKQDVVNNIKAVRQMQYDWILKKTRNNDPLFFYLIYKFFDLRNLIVPSNYPWPDFLSIHDWRTEPQTYKKLQRHIDIFKSHFIRTVAQSAYWTKLGLSLKFLTNKYSNTKTRYQTKKKKNTNETRQQAMRILQDAKYLPYK